ncbi:TonB-dependent receptor [Nafulsella turpanensis]|uniref:TonB-dependent receptor n=1 Tax=Nafulsella turpanensis TaxID=1265690 RepID=UPI0003487D73|nr:TonB-dependent receptor [Nafulsella turpanensis]
MKKILLACLATLLSIAAFAQGSIRGKVVDAETGDEIPGANVVLKGTTKGTMTNLDGVFVINNIEPGTREFVISFVGYLPIEFTSEVEEVGVTEVGVFEVEPEAIGLKEVQVTADIAIERQTPVAVSTIRGEELTQKVGNQEFVEVLKVTPSVYTTKGAGGFGDSRINIRGFDMRNTAVMINGVPVNDMENGWVYWSNWAGLSDVTSAIQVQRGLSASKLAISAVGGSINIITKATEARPGVKALAGVGNDGYQKYGVSASTGLMDNGFAASVLVSHTFGDGYIDGTQFKAYSYFASIAKQLGERHLLQLTATGAPQWHNQRAISGFDEDINGNNFTINYLDSIGHRFNPQWGYKDGEFFTFERNFYHKPIAFLNHYFTVNDDLEISTTAYASWGRGGGTGSTGRFANYTYPNTGAFRDENQQIDFDKIVALNSGQSVDGIPGIQPTNGQQLVNSSNGVVLRSSINSHNWYGVISSANADLSDELKLTAGVDLRTYKGLHYRRLHDLLGADGYVERYNVNNPDLIVTEQNAAGAIVSLKDDVPIAYNNDGLVRWAGLFGQLEYITEPFSAFVAISGSNQAFKRIDYFLYPIGENESDWESMLGANIKGGANYNFNDKHNVFANAGYYSRQPTFNGIFLNNTNEVNPDAKNEDVVGFEAGYGFRSNQLAFNLNAYRTAWSNRVISRGVRLDNGEDGSATFENIAQIHKGIELEGFARLSEKFTIDFMGSVGDWRYAETVNATVFNESLVAVDELTLYLDNVKVGNAAQTTASLGANYTFFDRLKVYATYFYAADLYADFNVAEDDIFLSEGGQAVKVPAYGLVDAGLNYSFEFSGMDFSWSANVNNVFNTEYIAELSTNYQGEGVEIGDNLGYFGFGRTWSTTLRVGFLGN